MGKFESLNLSELVKKFIRIKKTNQQIQILVCMISWSGPHSPVSQWECAAELPATATDSDIENAIKQTLEDQSYFKICVECNESNIVGHMHDGRICQGCAQKNHGVMY